MEVNGDGAKPHRTIREGDRIRIGRGFGHYQDIIVRIAIDQHVKKAEARALYDDVTPKPTPEEIEARRVERVPCGRGCRHYPAAAAEKSDASKKADKRGREARRQEPRAELRSLRASQPGSHPSVEAASRT